MPIYPTTLASHRQDEQFIVTGHVALHAPCISLEMSLPTLRVVKSIV
jgi:hypothetical protein